MVRRLPKLLSRAKTKVNWGHPPMLQKKTVDPNPCLMCGFCIPRDEHDYDLLVDICIAPARTKQMAEGWTTSTREGKRCKDFTDKIQTHIGDFE